MTSNYYIEYYFDVEETNTAIHFLFKNDLKNDNEKRKAAIGFELIKAWLIENIEEGITESLFGDRKQIVLNPVACMVFEEKREDFNKFKETIYINNLNNPREVAKLISNSKVINEKKNLKILYLGIVNAREKDWNNASELIVKYILDNNKIKTTKVDNENEMWIYREGIYIPQGRSEIKEIMRDILQEQYSAYVYNLVVAKIEASTFVNFEQFFNTCYKDLIPVENGILNILTNELKPFDDSYIFFNKLQVKYDPTKDCKTIDKFLNDILTSEEDKKVFYEYVGFCLYKEYTFEMALMLVGDGRNGKTKCVELIKRLLGVSNCSAISLYALSKGGSIVAKLFGKLANIASDLEATDLKDTGLIKGLTGQSLQTADRKYLNAIEFTNYAKMIFATNNLPLVFDTSKGFWSRWILLEFPYTFVTQEEYDVAVCKTKLKIKDPEIIDKISTPDELSGLLNTSIKGLQDCFKNRGFSFTKGSDEVKTKWIRQSNSVAAFCSDMLEEDYDSYILKKDFRKKYSDYCKLHNIKSKSDKVIKTTLEIEFGASEERKTILENYEHIWSGVKFKAKINYPGYPGFLEKSKREVTSLGVSKNGGLPGHLNEEIVFLRKQIYQYIKKDTEKVYQKKDFEIFTDQETIILEIIQHFLEEGLIILVGNNEWRVVK